MKPDKLDIKFQEAAAQNVPEYNERAWSDMEKLLDKEMPQKKKEKRRLLWIFLLLFIITGALVLINPFPKNSGETVTPPKLNSASKPTNIHDSVSDVTTNATIKDTNQHTIQLSQLPIHEINSQNSFSEKSIQNPKLLKIKNDKTAENNEVVIYEQNTTAENKNKADNEITDQDKIDKTEQPDNRQIVANITKKDSAEADKNNSTDQNKGSSSSTKEKAKESSHKKIVNPQSKNKFSNSFALDFSVGPDVSAVNIGDIGKINPVYGAGMRYNIGKRWTLRTGFYVEKKVYDAKPANYHPPAGFWNYYPDLNYIDANCKVYEVPLIINYNFSRASSHFWFASAGISSYFMKKEKYYYTPKDASVRYPYDSYTVNNKNQHYFSSVRLSAGYERKFNNSISVIAEPYINLPLAGVGYGKVELYSTGILFTLSIKPFAKK